MGIGTDMRRWAHGNSRVIMMGSSHYSLAFAFYDRSTLDSVKEMITLEEESGKRLMIF